MRTRLANLARIPGDSISAMCKYSACYSASVDRDSRLRRGPIYVLGEVATTGVRFTSSNMSLEHYPAIQESVSRAGGYGV